MADNTIMQTLYAQEFTEIYERKQSHFRGTVTTEGQVHGDNFIFILNGAADTAVERGANGAIPWASDDQTSATLTLKEYHHLARKNNFNVMSSSAPQRESMQKRGVVSINQKTDALIIAQMDTSTTSITAAAGSLSWMLQGCEKLWANDVPNDGNCYGALTPKAYAQMMKVAQFTSSDYIDERPFMRGAQMKDFLGVKWFMHTGLTDLGGASANCLLWHRDACGHGINQGDIQTDIGVNGEQDYSYARASAYQGAKLLQNEGIVIMNHDDTAAV